MSQTGALASGSCRPDQLRVFLAAHTHKTPVHSHPYAVVYVLKGGKVKYTMPDGSTKVSELHTGETLLRPPVTHADEALDDVDAILIEIKKIVGRDSRDPIWCIARVRSESCPAEFPTKDANRPSS